MENDTSNRRRFFHRLLGLTAVGAFAGLLQEKMGLAPVKAATGDNLKLGQENNADAQTTLASTNTVGTALRVDATATTGTAYGIDGITGAPNGTAIHGFVSSTGSTTGVWGESWSTAGTGVKGTGSTGVYGKSESANGVGVKGEGTGDHGIGVSGVSTNLTNGIGVYAGSGGAGTIALQAQSLGGTAVQATSFGRGIDVTGSPAGIFTGNVGFGTSNPARLVHLVGNNATFRMDRDANSSAFILVRTASGNFNTIWKSFYVGVDASGVNNGEFFIGDVGANVSGNSTKRLRIYNNGDVWVKNLLTGDLAFSNGVKATEEGQGLAFLNDAGQKIAVLDREGNLQVKGKITENPLL